MAAHQINDILSHLKASFQMCISRMHDSRESYDTWLLNDQNNALNNDIHWQAICFQVIRILSWNSSGSSGGEKFTSAFLLILIVRSGGIQPPTLLITIKKLDCRGVGQSMDS